MSNKVISVNINWKVRAKTTPEGHKIHRENYDKLSKLYPAGMPYKYSPIKEDENGYSEWQLWKLINDFGEYLYMGSSRVPFETTLEIIIPEYHKL